MTVRRGSFKFPLVNARTIFRALTGYNCLRDHLHRIGVMDSPSSVLRDVDQLMIWEQLDICISHSVWDDIVQKYWRARKLIA